MGLIFTLLMALASFAEAPCTDNFTPAEKRERASATWYQEKDFIKANQFIAQNEPYLYPNSQFIDSQRWTLKYQKYSSNVQNSGTFLRLFQMSSNAVELKKLVEAYEQYAKVSAELTEDLPNHVKMHLEMFESAKDKADYTRRYHESVDSLFKNYSGDIKKIKVFNCDYTSQPLDTLWFTSHAVKMIDDYGIALYGCKWEAARAAVQSRVKVLSPEAIGEMIHKAVGGDGGSGDVTPAVATPAVIKPSAVKNGVAK